MKQREEVIKELQKQIHLKNIANQKLSKALKEMLVVVSERRHIHEATGKSYSESCLAIHVNFVLDRNPPTGYISCFLWKHTHP